MPDNIDPTNTSEGGGASFSRRSVLKGIAAAGLASALVPGKTAEAFGRNPIRKEN